MSYFYTEGDKNVTLDEILILLGPLDPDPLCAFPGLLESFAYQGIRRFFHSSPPREKILLIL